MELTMPLSMLVQCEGRTPRYGSAVLQALITIWAASTFLGPVRLAAGMAVTDELLFKEGVQFVDDEVMDNSVPEIRREDFALNSSSTKIGAPYSSSGKRLNGILLRRRPGYTGTRAQCCFI